MKITKQAYEKILASYPKAPPENGGILGERDGVICEYVHDCSEQSCDSYVYVPDIEYLNRCIDEWEAQGTCFAGMIHSHPENELTLSSGDMEYIEKIMEGVPEGIKKYFPIVIPPRDIIVYRAEREENKIVIEEDNIETVSDIL